MVRAEEGKSEGPSHLQLLGPSPEPTPGRSRIWELRVPGCLGDYCVKAAAKIGHGRPAKVRTGLVLSPSSILILSLPSKERNSFFLQAERPKK